LGVKGTEKWKPKHRNRISQKLDQNGAKMGSNGGQRYWS
jgi:hypothetical protein